MYKSILENKEVKRRWYGIDATDRSLGRMSTSIALLLLGKNECNYTPHIDSGGYVVVRNLRKLKKSGVILYKRRYRHSGHAGALKSKSYTELYEARPELLLYDSVRRMLPKNKTNKRRMSRLKLFLDDYDERYTGAQIIEYEGEE
jgi:large subunit ribosomal protein L13